MNDNYSAGSGQGIYAGRFAPAAAQLDLVVAGDSLTADTYPSAGFRWGVPLSRSPLKLVYNAGVASDTLDLLWARWQSTVLDKLPNGGVIFLRIGTNSVGNVDFNSKYQRFIDTVLARSDLKMVMFALPPKNQSGTQILIHNDFIAGTVSQDPTKLFFIQDSTALGDASYNYLQAYYIDTIHMNALGQYTQGASQQTQIAAIFGTSNNALYMSGDSYLTNPAILQFIKNPLNASSGADWTISASGAGSSATKSVEAAEVGDTNQTPWLVMTINAIGGASHSFNITSALAHPAITAGQYSKARFSAELWFDDLQCDPLNQLRITSQAGSNIFTPLWRMGLADIGTIQHKVIIDQELVVDPALSWSANTISLTITVQSDSALAGTAGQLKIRNASIRAIA